MLLKLCNLVKVSVIYLENYIVWMSLTKRPVTISLSDDILELIEDARGAIPRSSWIEIQLRDVFASANPQVAFSAPRPTKRGPEE